MRVAPRSPLLRFSSLQSLPQFMRSRSACQLPLSSAPGAMVTSDGDKKLQLGKDHAFARDNDAARLLQVVSCTRLLATICPCQPHIGFAPLLPRASGLQTARSIVHAAQFGVLCTNNRGAEGHGAPRCRAVAPLGLRECTSDCFQPPPFSWLLAPQHEPCDRSMCLPHPNVSVQKPQTLDFSRFNWRQIPRHARSKRSSEIIKCVSMKSRRWFPCFFCLRNFDVAADVVAGVYHIFRSVGNVLRNRRR